MRALFVTLLVAVSASARPPKAIDVGERTVGPLGVHRPAALFIVSGPKLPPILPDELPTEAWAPYSTWLEATEALRRDRTDTKPNSARTDSESPAKAHEDAATALMASLDAAAAKLGGAGWTLLGALRRDRESARVERLLDAYDACVSAGSEACPEPVRDDAASLEALSHVGRGTRAAVLGWARDLEGRVHDDAGRAAPAMTAFRSAVALADAPPDVRADAALALGRRLSQSRSPEAVDWLDRAARVGVGDVATGAHLLRLAANARWGDAKAALCDALAWPEGDGLVAEVAPEVSEWATVAATRLGPTAAAALATCTGSATDHAARLLAAADALAEQGIATWARLDLDAAVALSPELAADADAIRARLMAAPPDDAAAWATRVASWCSDAAPEADAATSEVEPTAVVTLTPRRDGGVTTKLDRPTGAIDAVAKCLTGRVPPPERADLGAITFRVVVRPHGASVD